MSPLSSTLRAIAVLTWAGGIGIVALAALAPDRYGGILQGQIVWAAISAVAASFIWRSEWRAARVLSGPVTGMFLWVLIDLMRAVIGWPERLPETTDTVVYLIVGVPTALASAAVLVILIRHDFRPELEAERLSAEQARSEWVTGLVGHIRSLLEDARTGAVPVLAAATRAGGLANGMDGAIPAATRSAVYGARDDLRAIASLAAPDQNARINEAAARFEQSLSGSPPAGAASVARGAGWPPGVVIVAVVVGIVVVAALVSFMAGGWTIFIE